MLFVSHSGWPSRFLLTINLILLLIFSGRCSAQAEENIEYKIKAAYLYNFTKFITWPEKASPTFNLCVIGNSPVKQVLSNLEGKTALDKPIRIQLLENSKQGTDCHIAYFEQIDAANLAPTVPALQKTLIVSSQPLFAENGGMIGFVLEDEKIKLHINLKALKLQGFGISAKLIEVATLVGDANNE